MNQDSKQTQSGIQSRNSNPLLAILAAMSSTSGRDEFDELGIKVGKLYTDHGLPLDMALAKFGTTKDQKILVLNGALGWLIEHKRNSGATEKALDRQRKANRETMRAFVETGETGVY